jgi:hypothetical protein
VRPVSKTNPALSLVTVGWPWEACSPCYGWDCQVPVAAVVGHPLWLAHKAPIRPLWEKIVVDGLEVELSWVTQDPLGLYWETDA